MLLMARKLLSLFYYVKERSIFFITNAENYKNGGKRQIRDRTRESDFRSLYLKEKIFSSIKYAVMRLWIYTARIKIN